MKVDGRENLERGIALTIVGDGELGLEEHVEYTPSALDHLADAKTHGDVVAVVLHVERPSAGAPKIGALAHLDEKQRLDDREV